MPFSADLRVRVWTRGLQRRAGAKRSAPVSVKADGMAPLAGPRGFSSELMMLLMGWTLDLGQTSPRWHFYHFSGFTQGLLCRSTGGAVYLPRDSGEQGFPHFYCFYSIHTMEPFSQTGIKCYEIYEETSTVGILST